MNLWIKNGGYAFLIIKRSSIVTNFKRPFY